MKGRGVFLQGMLLTGCAALASACSHQQIYDSTTELRAQDCRNLSERERYDCEQRARSTSYKQYRDARDDAAQGKDQQLGETGRASGPPGS